MTDLSNSLVDAAARLAANEITSEALVVSCLECARDAGGEGGRVFTDLYAEQALEQARVADRMRRAGVVPSRFLGVPISIKDLFDEAGRTTRAGSVVLAGQPPAQADAPAIDRLKAAGFIIVGRTNMTEFAYSGLGLNPHYGTPLNPFDRGTGRIPGGSSSGAAVSVSDGMAFGGIGSDTGGSCRIPAALCGLVGYKPTAARVSRHGVFPLSTTLDSIGSIAGDVPSVAALDAIMAGSPAADPYLGTVRGLRIGVPQTIVLDDMDAKVAADFDRTLARLTVAGACAFDMPMRSWKRIADLGTMGGFVAAEAYARHRRILDDHAAEYDPRVRERILKGRDQSAADYLDLLAARQSLIHGFEDDLNSVDVLAFPTTPVIAPELAPLEADTEVFNATNLLILRNSTTINLSNGCAISLPMHEPETAPTGLTLAAPGGKDEQLLSVALTVEGMLGGAVFNES
ncbi:amidase [Microbaculum marinisediminis]|uniref:Amidase n=1 Tax=Microbaculum marinisediminis TaxID=2931392 RepID=A0AAW5R6G6_9HYPH|nr:amidase [Microbaculum sp. A6E488]MCT8974224.1 amidase [Microbaculum sp. A6E488]